MAVKHFGSNELASTFLFCRNGDPSEDFLHLRRGICLKTKRRSELGHFKPGAWATHFAAIQYAWKNGARIFNVSLGYSKPQFFASLESAMEKYPDSLFVVAAGNETQDLRITPAYPASNSRTNMIVVASIDDTGSLVTSSNYSPEHVDLAAVGAYVKSEAPGGREEYLGGTSMATPQVTRVAAKLKFANPSLGPLQIREILCRSADRTSRPEILEKVRCGILNEARALQMVRP